MERERPLDQQLSDVLTETDASMALRALNEHLYKLLQPPTYSEYIHLLRQYSNLVRFLPKYNLPASSKRRRAELSELIQLLESTRPELVVGKIDDTNLKSTFPIWATLRKYSLFQKSAVTGLLGITLLLEEQGELALSRNLASGLRGAGSRRARTLQQKRSGYYSERLLDILSSVDLCPSPSEQCDALLDYLERIQEAKPNFAKLLEQLCERFHTDSGSSPIRVQIASVSLGNRSESGEAPQEEAGDLSYTSFEDHLDRPSMSRSVQRAYHQQAIYSQNDLLLEGHVTALTLSEALLFAHWLGQQADGALAARDSRKSRVLLTAALVLATGRSLKRVIRLISDSQLSANHLDEALDFEKGELTLRATMPTDAYDPSPEESTNLRPTQQAFRLPLPPKLAERLALWAKMPPIDHDSEAWEAETMAAVSQYRNLRDISWGRIRSWLATRIRTLSKDPAFDYWITGNTHGRAQSFIYYAQVEAKDIAEIYVAAVWPLFGNSPTVSIRKEAKLGSKAVPDHAVIQGAVKRLRRYFNQPEFSLESQESVVDRHNLMMRYTSFMLVAVAGHRMTSALLSLKRHDFLLSLDGKTWCGLANFSDKLVDAAHYLRPVPIGTRLAEQIGLYLAHLADLSDWLESHDSPNELRQMVAGCLTGSQPLFFEMSEQLEPRLPEFENWHNQYKNAFPALPSNWPRHLLATELRLNNPPSPQENRTDTEIGGGESACLLLGHLSILGDPFGGDSPTVIRHLATTYSDALDRNFKLQKWMKRGGLTPRKANFLPKHLPTPDLTLKHWKNESETVEKWAKAQHKRINRSIRTRVQNWQDLVRHEFLDALKKKKPDLHAHLASNFSISKPKIPIRLTQEQLTHLLSGPSTEKDSKESERKEKLYVRLVIVRSLLSEAKKKGVYTGPLPAEAYKFKQCEQTPLVSGIYRGYETILFLRNNINKVLTVIPDAPGDDEATTLLAQYAIVVILFGNVYRKSILEGLLKEHAYFRCSPNYPDAILIELHTHPPAIWILFGLPAILTARLAKLSLSAKDIDFEALSRRVWQLLPEECRPDTNLRTKTLEMLLETAGLAATIELSGLARTALGVDPSQASWALPLDRTLSLLENDLSSGKQAQRTNDQPARRFRNKKTSSEWYRYLCREIPRSQPTKSQSPSSSIPTETKRRYRMAIARKIAQEAIARDLTEIEQALGIWAEKMLLEPKMNSSNPLAFDSIHTYLSSIGNGLIQEVGERRIGDIEDDEWADIYGQLLDRYEPGTVDLKLNQIYRLHKLLEMNFNASPLLAECLPEAKEKEAKVRPSLSLPSEVRCAIDLLKYSGEHEAGRGDSRELTQGLIAMMLMSATGCRIGEIAGLQFRDLYIPPDKHDLQTLPENCELRIRPNDFRDTKTRAARRVIPFIARKEETEIISRYLEAESKRLGETHYRPTRLFFLELDAYARGIPTGSEVLRYYISASLRNFSPLKLISYDLRKLQGTRRQAEMALSQSATPKTFDTSERLCLPHSAPTRLRLPRFSRTCCMLHGHARPRTTNHSYGHLPWLYLIETGQRLSQHISFPALAIIFDRKVDSISKAIRRSTVPASTWALGKFKQDRRNKRQLNHHEPRSLSLLRTKGVPSVIDYLADAHPFKIEEQYAAYGIDESVYLRIREEAAVIYADTRFALLPSLLTCGDQRKSRTDLPPRWTEITRRVRELAESIHSPGSRVCEIAQAYRQSMTPKTPQTTVYLRKPLAAELISELEKLLPKKVLHVTENGSQVAIQIRENSRNLTRHLGWILLSITIYMSQSSSLASSSAPPSSKS
ncbi:hypothetical protein [Wenzhouxiangella limi]|uniref:Uncharacterized protein n=1 Tax=Wenzhouxiangella limi TaxID=2707351 RepID=A0A845V6H2_9GAMM|nr:hypothetical protein [Wenzhouxiangella limi]NDY96766.1 hypothetical protein [Wenzhouxiangella limi]